MRDYGALANQFANDVVGSHVDVDGYYGAQCWDLSAKYAISYIGCPSFPTGSGGAEGLYRIFADPLGAYFDRLPASAAQAGDIGVCPASFSPPWGHTFVILSRNGNTLNVVEQNGNNPGGNAYCATRYISNLSGVLRPKQRGVNDMVPDKNHLDALFIAFRNRYPSQGEYDAYIGKISYDGMVEALNSGSERKSVSDAVNVGMIAIHDNWQQQIYNLQAALDTQTKAVAQANADLTAARQQLQDLGNRPSQAQLDALTKQLQDAEKTAMTAQANYEKAYADLQTAQQQQAADLAKGDSFLRIIGQWLAKYIPGLK